MLDDRAMKPGQGEQGSAPLAVSSAKPLSPRTLHCLTRGYWAARPQGRGVTQVLSTGQVAPDTWCPKHKRFVWVMFLGVLGFVWFIMQLHLTPAMLWTDSSPLVNRHLEQFLCNCDRTGSVALPTYKKQLFFHCWRPAWLFFPRLYICLIFCLDSCVPVPELASNFMQ